MKFMITKPEATNNTTPCRMMRSRLLIGAIYTRDLIILQGVVLLVASGFVIMNFIVDLLYAVLDPRIRHGHA